jgi:carbamoyltransferase
MYYTAITQYLGFWKFGDEYKVMGLAAYGEPSHLEEFRRIVRSNGSMGFRLGLEYFAHHRQGADMSWRESDKTPVVGKIVFRSSGAKRLGPTRPAEAPVEQREKDLAATLQARLEEVLFENLNALHARTKQKNRSVWPGAWLSTAWPTERYLRAHAVRAGIRAAGGRRRGPGRLARLTTSITRSLGRPRDFVMKHSYWGPGYSEQQIRAAIERSDLEKAGVSVSELPEAELLRAAAQRIADGDVLGWYSGRAEWGPRALGNRSILADPRRADMKDILNRRIKHREMFRPFAPSILAEATGEFFEISHPSPFMTFAYAVRPEKRGALVAPTHVTARRGCKPSIAKPIRDTGASSASSAI